LSDSEKKELRSVVRSLQHEEETTAITNELAGCIGHGTAFNHAGLDSTQRRSIEQGFKNHLIKCLVATPTLAAGVNIPARRVIIRDLWRYDLNFGMQPIPILEYKQQAGRAGRPQYDSAGEAITIAKNSEQKDKIFYDYILGETEAIYSKLGSQPALRMHLLAAIATSFVSDKESIQRFIDSTFLAYQTTSTDLEGEIEQALGFLLENKFIEEKQSTYTPTLLGTRTSSLYIDPLSAVQIQASLHQAQKKPASTLAYFHMICSTPDMQSLYLRKGDQWVEELAEQFQGKSLVEQPVPSTSEYEWYLSALKTAALLEDWINEIPEDGLVSKYDIGPGDIHTVVEKAEWLLHAAREFSRMYRYESLSDLGDLIMQIRYGCKKELLNLVSLRGIGRVRARALYKEGFTTVTALRDVPLERLAQIKTIGKTIATNIKKQIGESEVSGNTNLAVTLRRRKRRS